VLTRIYFRQRPSFLLQLSSVNLNVSECINISVCHKHTLDYSRFPKLKEDDLDEQFIRGTGPGGQAVNKTNNCVLLVHKPTGTVFSVKVSIQKTLSVGGMDHTCTQYSLSSEV
jgi:hypothetical protein